MPRKGPLKLATELVYSGDHVQHDAQDAGRETAAALNRVPFLRGRLVSIRFSGAVTVVVSHKLGTVARCMQISTDYSGGGALNARQSTNQTGLDPKNQMRLISNTGGTADFWFYPKASKDIPTGAVHSP